MSDVTKLEMDAQLMREVAFDSVVSQLKQGEIQQQDAVTALRHAYRRAEHHRRSMPWPNPNSLPDAKPSASS